MPVVEGWFSLRTDNQAPQFHRTQRMKHAFLAAALAATWLALPAEAAKFEIPNDQSIVISGRIDLGDEAHFLSALSRLRRGGTIEVHLSSPGGSVLAAMKIADIVRRAGLTTQVPYRATCASACVLVFAAGVTRTADADATIAVHSAGMPGQADVDQKLIENGGTLAATTLMARIMSSYGAPPSVVGKMVATPTEEAAVLTRADLEAWNVRITRFVSGEEKPQADQLSRAPSVPPTAPSPIYPTQPMHPSGQPPTTWSSNVLRIVETFGPQAWEDKVAYLRNKGSAFFKRCKDGGCYFEATYTGEYATIVLYLTEVRGGRPVRQTWCTSDPNAWARLCSEQGSGSWAMRFDGSDWHRM
jgi:hypothetical protein